jgi:hypothetical protein
VRLLETALIESRTRSTRADGSFGLTTWRTHHVDIDGATMTFQFRGKGARRHRVDVDDRRLARAVARCQYLPGQELFQFLDGDGERRSVDSRGANAQSPRRQRQGLHGRPAAGKRYPPQPSSRRTSMATWASEEATALAAGGASHDHARMIFEIDGKDLKKFPTARAARSTTT